MFVSTKKAAELMGISARMLYNLCNEGKVSFLRVGPKKYLFDCDILKEELRALMIPADNCDECSD